MRTFNYELVNVFAQTHFGGNPLAVFTDATGLDAFTMQCIAQQMNLSETVFILPSTAPNCVAALRIFTPNYELPFAGHPVIGSAAVLNRLQDLSYHFNLETYAGIIPIERQKHNHHERFTLCANMPKQRISTLDRAKAAKMFGLKPADIASNPVWINTGSEQLLIQISSKAALMAAKPNFDAFCRGARQNPGQEPVRCVAYLWHISEDPTILAQTSQTFPIATVRLFSTQNGGIVEDPGTGSACANLGGWCVLNQLGPLNWRVEQGEALNRPNILYLSIDSNNRISVGGEVIFIGVGEILVP